MEIALIKNNKIVKIGHYKEVFSNTTFPPTGPNDEFMKENSALGVTVWRPHNKSTEKLVSCEPVIEDNQVFTVEVADKTEEDLAADIAVESANVREKRDQLLKESDWTQVTDAPFTKAVKTSWSTYRQSLRDITTQEGFPFNVTFPDTPI
jgi:hypothetical protein